MNLYNGVGKKVWIGPGSVSAAKDVISGAKSGMFGDEEASMLFIDGTGVAYNNNGDNITSYFYAATSAQGLVHTSNLSQFLSS